MELGFSPAQTVSTRHINPNNVGSEMTRLPFHDGRKVVVGRSQQIIYHSDRLDANLYAQRLFLISGN
jgi:hypothetical protein